ncbi:glycosyltransferase family 2 protein [Halorussus lipolyticus]|uniref:glycosyltransferase family 2 protein n=1 Tax=Halorussus lipolyticus TaxID=3034024 RepID=UPI0023E8C812|nr:glycosyltransferase family 2 protein [Halorussus sp. DT80]
MRAHQHGHYVLVYCRPGVQLPDFVRERNVSVLTPEKETTASEEDVLRMASQHLGFPGLLFHDTAGEYVDYDRSRRENFEDDDAYVVEPSTRPGPDSDLLSMVAAIPAFEESATIGDVVRETSEYVDDVLVVDDGSSDDTAEVARDAGAIVVEHDRNQGYGGALRTAFRCADRWGIEDMVVLDADGQHDPADVPKLVEARRERDADLVIGSRFLPGNETSLPVYRRFGLSAINLLTNASLGLVQSPISDTQSGFRAYGRRAVESLAEDPEIGEGMSASTDILYHASREGYDIEEVSTTIQYDVENGNSHHPVAHGLHLVANILRTVERGHPVAILGVPGFLGSISGIGLGFWTLHIYVQTQVFPIGYAILSVFLGLAGIFACFTAIVLHALTETVQS